MQLISSAKGQLSLEPSLGFLSSNLPKGPELLIERILERYETLLSLRTTAHSSLCQELRQIISQGDESANVLFSYLRLQGDQAEIRDLHRSAVLRDALTSNHQVDRALQASTCDAVIAAVLPIRNTTESQNPAERARLILDLACLLSNADWWQALQQNFVYQLAKAGTLEGGQESLISCLQRPDRSDEVRGLVEQARSWSGQAGLGPLEGTELAALSPFFEAEPSLTLVKEELSRAQDFFSLVREKAPLVRNVLSRWQTDNNLPEAANSGAHTWSEFLVFSGPRSESSSPSREEIFALMTGILPDSEARRISEPAAAAECHELLKRLDYCFNDPRGLIEAQALLLNRVQALQSDSAVHQFLEASAGSAEINPGLKAWASAALNPIPLSLPVHSQPEVAARIIEADAKSPELSPGNLSASQREYQLKRPPIDTVEGLYIRTLDLISIYSGYHRINSRFNEWAKQLRRVEFLQCLPAEDFVPALLNLGDAITICQTRRRHADQDLKQIPELLANVIRYSTAGEASCLTEPGNWVKGVAHQISATGERKQIGADQQLRLPGEKFSQDALKVALSLLCANGQTPRNELLRTAVVLALRDPDSGELNLKVRLFHAESEREQTTEKAGEGARSLVLGRLLWVVGSTENVNDRIKLLCAVLHCAQASQTICAILKSPERLARLLTEEVVVPRYFSNYTANPGQELSAQILRLGEALRIVSGPSDEMPAEARGFSEVARSIYHATYESEIRNLIQLVDQGTWEYLAEEVGQGDKIVSMDSKPRVLEAGELPRHDTPAGALWLLERAKRIPEDSALVTLALENLRPNLISELQVEQILPKLLDLNSGLLALNGGTYAEVLPCLSDTVAQVLRNENPKAPQLNILVGVDQNGVPIYSQRHVRGSFRPRDGLSSLLEYALPNYQVPESKEAAGLGTIAQIILKALDGLELEQRLPVDQAVPLETLARLSLILETSAADHPDAGSAYRIVGRTILKLGVSRLAYLKELWRLHEASNEISGRTVFGVTFGTKVPLTEDTKPIAGLTRAVCAALKDPDISEVEASLAQALLIRWTRLPIAERALADEILQLRQECDALERVLEIITSSYGSKHKHSPNELAQARVHLANITGNPTSLFSPIIDDLSSAPPSNHSLGDLFITYGIKPLDWTLAPLVAELRARLTLWTANREELAHKESVLEALDSRSRRRIDSFGKAFPSDQVIIVLVDFLANLEHEQSDPQVCAAALELLEAATINGRALRDSKGRTIAFGPEQTIVDTLNIMPLPRQNLLSRKMLVKLIEKRGSDVFVVETDKSMNPYLASLTSLFGFNLALLPDVHSKLILGRALISILARIPSHIQTFIEFLNDPTGTKISAAIGLDRAIETLLDPGKAHLSSAAIRNYTVKIRDTFLLNWRKDFLAVLVYVATNEQDSQRRGAKVAQEILDQISSQPEHRATLMEMHARAAKIYRPLLAKFADIPSTSKTKSLKSPSNTGLPSPGIDLEFDEPEHKMYDPFLDHPGFEVRREDVTIDEIPVSVSSV